MDHKLYVHPKFGFLMHWQGALFAYDGEDWQLVSACDDQWFKQVMGKDFEKSFLHLIIGALIEMDTADNS